MRVFLTLFIVLITVLLISSATETSVSMPENEVTGSLNVNDETVEIRHAYVRIVQSEDGPGYHIILTDTPANSALLNDEGKMWELSRKGELHYLLIHLNADGTTRIDMRHPAFKPLGYMNVGGSNYLIEPGEVTEDLYEARVYMAEPASSFGDTWMYDINFAADIAQGESW